MLQSKQFLVDHDKEASIPVLFLSRADQGTNSWPLQKMKHPLQGNKKSKNRLCVLETKVTSTVTNERAVANNYLDRDIPT